MTQQEPTRRRWLRRTAIAVPTAIVLVGGGAYVATEVAGLPDPVTIARVGAQPPSTWGEVFAQRAIPAREPRPLVESPQALPETVPWKGEEISVDDFLERTHTNAFVVLQDGEIAHEWYAEGAGVDQRLPSFSVAKSAVSLLVGQAIGRGELAEDDLIVDLVPAWRTGGEFDDVTVRHLLDMTSGVDVSEVYNKYWPFTGTSLMYLVEDLPQFVLDHREVDSPPGEVGTYRSINTQLLALVLEEVTGKNVSTLLADDIWTPMGAEADAAWSLDSEGGTEKAFAELHATARDFARMGQLVLDEGRAGGQQVVPSGWIERISTPAPDTISNWGYSAQWWHVPETDVRDPDADPADLSALGVYGQYIHVSPETGTVLVKLSDHGVDADEFETVQVLRSLASSLG